MKLAAALALAFSIVACTGEKAALDRQDVGGTLVIATTVEPNSLFPPLVGNTPAKQITEQLYDYLADVGPGMNTRSDVGFRSALTDGWRWSSDSLSIAFHLTPLA